MLEVVQLLALMTGIEAAGDSAFLENNGIAVWKNKGQEDVCCLNSSLSLSSTA